MAHKPNFSAAVRERDEIASSKDADSFAAANTQKAAVRTRVDALLRPETVFVPPTSPGTAPMRDEKESALNDFRTRAFEMLCPAGLASLPQLSVPAGVVDGGPVGLRLLGSKGQDRQLIALAQSAGIGGAPR